MKKVRADNLLVARGLCESRAQAQRLIMAGQVRIGTDHVIAKPSQTIPADADLNVVESCPYVSRGAYKLLPALEQYLPELPSNAVILDLGASTGGFTDLLLQRGASRSYAVDSGHGQLHYRLRQDERVVCLENTNARYLTAEQIPDPVDLVVADLSFISVRKVLPANAPFLKPGGWAFILVKPQFEARREEVGKGGVVRDQSVRDRCVRDVRDFAERELSWRCAGIVPSPIKGPKGNQEYIAVFRCPAAGKPGLDAPAGIGVNLRRAK